MIIKWGVYVKYGYISGSVARSKTLMSRDILKSKDWLKVTSPSPSFDLYVYMDFGEETQTERLYYTGPSIIHSLYN